MAARLVEEYGSPQAAADSVWALARKNEWHREGERAERGDIEETFEQELGQLFAQAETPRLSDLQIKAPMSLLADGTLVPAMDRPFTHILKPASVAGRAF